MAKIFDHILNRDLAHVVRFNNRPQHFPESVAEHSFYVAYIVLIICHLLDKKKVKVDTKKALSMALIHDAEEAFSGDILNPFKHFNEKVFQAIRAVNKQTIGEVFADLPTDLNNELVGLWNSESAADTIEAQVVKAADTLQLLAKCYEEVKAGNAYFNDIYKERLSHMNNLDLTWWKKIKNEVLSDSNKQI